MADGSLLFGLLLLHGGLLLARPGVFEWRARQDRARSRRFWALRMTATGLVIAAAGCTLLVSTIGWGPGRAAFATLTVAGIVALPLLAAAELNAALHEDSEGEQRRLELGLLPARPMWHPAAVVLLWAGLIALSVLVSFAVQALADRWSFAISPAGRLIDIGVALVLLIPARWHVVVQKRRRRRRDREQTANDRRLLEV